jgi:hypothetical protein
MNIEDKINRAFRKALENDPKITRNTDKVIIAEIEVPQFCHNENTHIINLIGAWTEYGVRYSVPEYKSKSRSKAYITHYHASTFFKDYNYPDLTNIALFTKATSILKSTLEDALEERVAQTA